MVSVGSIPILTIFILHRALCKIKVAHAMQRKTMGGEDMDVPMSIMKSKYRQEIDQMLRNGDTYTAISNWLRNNGETISRNIISKYHKFCFNINKEAADLYQQRVSEQVLRGEAEKVVSTLELYDKYIALGANVNPTMINDDKMADLALKAGKQREDFLREHGDQEAEVQTQLLKEIRDELVKGSLDKLIQGLSDERTKKRIVKATDPS